MKKNEKKINDIELGDHITSIEELAIGEIFYYEISDCLFQHMYLGKGKTNGYSSIYCIKVLLHGQRTGLKASEGKVQEWLISDRCLGGVFRAPK